MEFSGTNMKELRSNLKNLFDSLKITDILLTVKDPRFWKYWINLLKIETCFYCNIRKFQNFWKPSSSLSASSAGFSVLNFDGLGRLTKVLKGLRDWSIRKILEEIILILVLKNYLTDREISFGVLSDFFMRRPIEMAPLLTIGPWKLRLYCFGGPFFIWSFILSKIFPIPGPAPTLRAIVLN